MAVMLSGAGQAWFAPAARDDAQGRFREGDAVGFVDEEIVAWGRPREALRSVLERLAEDAELITCLRGVDAPLDDEAVQALAAGEVEFELSDGGQPSYWWLLSRRVGRRGDPLARPAGHHLCRDDPDGVRQLATPLDQRRARRRRRFATRGPPGSQRRCELAGREGASMAAADRWGCIDGR